MSFGANVSVSGDMHSVNITNGVLTAELELGYKIKKFGFQEDEKKKLDIIIIKKKE